MKTIISTSLAFSLALVLFGFGCAPVRTPALSRLSAQAQIPDGPIIALPPRMRAETQGAILEIVRTEESEAESCRARVRILRGETIPSILATFLADQGVGVCTSEECTTSDGKRLTLSTQGVWTRLSLPPGNDDYAMLMRVWQPKVYIAITYCDQAGEEEMWKKALNDFR